MKIVLDTNFLVYCAKQKIDYTAEIEELVGSKPELIVPEQVVEELRQLRQRAEKYADRVAAGLALEIIKAENVKIESIQAKNADDAVANLSKGNIAATLDFRLLKKVSRAVIIRGRKKLAFR